MDEPLKEVTPVNLEITVSKPFYCYIARYSY